MARARSKQTPTRASGETTAEEVAQEQAKDLDQPIDDKVVPEEREKTFITPGFSRMRMDWRGDDKHVVRRAQSIVESRILRNFSDAYQVMGKVFDLVRTAEVDQTTGEIKTDQYGMVIWKRTPDGGFEEDWTKLTRGEKENLLFMITTRIFGWRERADNAWGEAMFAKAQWQERFAIEYDKPMAGTIDDRTAVGNMNSAEERYFAIFLTIYSRKAESIVRSMENLGQRLKDTLE